MSHICPYCGNDAKLVTGEVIYPHRKDLFDLKFWHCEPCDAYVGCHKKGAWVPDSHKHSDGTIPLGRLANAELREAKKSAHAAFDPIWTDQRMTRKTAYKWLANALGIDRKECHIGMMDAERCRKVVEVCRAITPNIHYGETA